MPPPDESRKNSLEELIKLSGGLRLVSEPPDFGAEITDSAAYLKDLGKRHTIVILKDNQHSSVPERKKLGEIVEAIQPGAIAFEEVGFKGASAKAVLFECNKIIDFMKSDASLPELKEQLPIMLANQEFYQRFVTLQRAGAVTESVDNRHGGESFTIVEKIKIYAQRQDTLAQKGNATEEEKSALHEQSSNAWAELDRLSRGFENYSSVRVKSLSDDNKKGPTVWVIGARHTEGGNNVVEQLVKLGVAREKIAVVDVEPAETVPEKAMQRGGAHGETATFFVHDEEKGKSWEELGGKLAAEARFLDTKSLGQIQDIEFTENGGYTGMRLIRDRSDPFLGSTRIDAVAQTDTARRADKIKLSYGLKLDAPVVEVDISALPIKNPGEKLNAVEKKQWMDRLQEGVNALKGKVEQQGKTRDAPAKAPVRDLGTLSPKAAAAPPRAQPGRGMS